MCANSMAMSLAGHKKLFFKKPGCVLFFFIDTCDLVLKMCSRSSTSTAIGATSRTPQLTEKHVRRAWNLKLIPYQRSSHKTSAMKRVRACTHDPICFFSNFFMSQLCRRTAPFAEGIDRCFNPTFLE